MSVIGSNLLQKIIVENNTYEPKEILTQLNKEIVIAMSQKEHKNSDGIDLALIRIDEQTRTNNEISVVFSGAKRPLYVGDISASRITKIPGTRKSIGGNFQKKADERSFTQEVLQVTSDQILYMVTDGLHDQNRKDRLKFSERGLIKLLEENLEFTFPDQYKTIHDTFEEFMLGTEQRDDMLLLGLNLFMREDTSGSK
jgi:serine phosphatase RsbU (regulator of sigma subunit)